MTATSPFPGMDPYMERRWGDVHQRLVTYSCDQLQGRLPADLRALLQERIVVEAAPPVSQGFYPDVHVIEDAGYRDSGGGTAVAEVVAPSRSPPRHPHPAAPDRPRRVA